MRLAIRTNEINTSFPLRHCLENKVVCGCEKTSAMLAEFVIGVMRKT